MSRDGVEEGCNTTATTATTTATSTATKTPSYTKPIVLSNVKISKNTTFVRQSNRGEQLVKKHGDNKITQKKSSIIKKKASVQYVCSKPDPVSYMKLGLLVLYMLGIIFTIIMLITSNGMFEFLYLEIWLLFIGYWLSAMWILIWEYYVSKKTTSKIFSEYNVRLCPVITVIYYFNVICNLPTVWNIWFRLSTRCDLQPYVRYAFLCSTKLEFMESSILWMVLSTFAPVEEGARFKPRMMTQHSPDSNGIGAQSSQSNDDSKDDDNNNDVNNSGDGESFSSVHIIIEPNIDKHITNNDFDPNDYDVYVKTRSFLIVRVMICCCVIVCFKMLSNIMSCLAWSRTQLYWLK